MNITSMQPTLSFSGRYPVIQAWISFSSLFSHVIYTLLDIFKTRCSGSSQIVRILAVVGAAFLLFAWSSLIKLVLAIQNKCDYATAFLVAPPRDAFAGKIFWITGSSSGIGRALVLHLCSSHDKIKLILSSRRQDVLEEVAAECKKRGRSGAAVKVLTVNLADHSSFPSKVEEALSLYGGRIDVLINNGGVSTRSTARDASFDVDKYVTDVDYLSYVALTKLLVPSWESQSNSTKPIVVNTSSVAGKIGVPVHTAYSGAKFAIHGWFDAFREEQVMVGHPVDVLNVVLGSTRTNIAKNAITASPDETFGCSDKKIEACLNTDFVVEKVLASLFERRKEIWIAPRKELLVLYLNQYFPEMAHRLLAKILHSKAQSKMRNGETVGRTRGGEV